LFTSSRATTVITPHRRNRRRGRHVAVNGGRVNTEVRAPQKIELAAGAGSQQDRIGTVFVSSDPPANVRRNSVHWQGKEERVDEGKKPVGKKDGEGRNA